MVKKGDTLVEVCIAIGIFSLIAIGVASVMSSGTAGSQTALETTITREEIDAQADALRFIHESYLSGQNANNDDYNAIWTKITEQAQSANDSITQFTPTTCAELYDQNAANSIYKQKGFVLNTRQLSNPDQALVSITDPNSFAKFQPTSTYPRLLFGNAINNSDTDALVNGTNTSSTNLYRAEGIYIVAVKDGGTEMVVEGNTTTSTPAFYDFYIRSCWYGIDAERPTTISTVIRLYDPLSIQTHSQSGTQYNKGYYLILYNNPTSSFPPPVLPYTRQRIYAGNTGNLANPRNGSYGYRFLCWSVNKGSCSGEYYVPPEDTINPPADFTATITKNLWAVWNMNDSKIVFNKGDGDFADGASSKTETCKAFTSCEPTYTIPSKYFDADFITRSGYRFLGWSTERNATTPTYTGSKPQITIHGETTNLYPVWGEQNEVITILASWTSNTDYDSFMELSKPGSNYYISADWGTSNINVTYNGSTYSLVTGTGDGRGGYNGKYSEKFVINTLGGKNYYYSITKYSGGWPNGVGNDITITVSGPYMGTKTFRSSSISCGSGYWNVFAYKNGRIITRNTCTSTMQYDY